MGEKVASLYAEIGADTSKLEKGLKETKSGLAGLYEQNKMAIRQLGVFAGVAIAAGAAVKGIADDTAEYNRAIREGTQVTGMAANSFSRLVQVGDDWGISAEQITTSLAMMRQKGLQPSIESIADLADEYVRAGDTAEFAETATEKLGRGWKELAPLLSLGRKGLIDATAAIDSNLIATEKSIKTSRDYEIALDNLNDQMLALKLTAGNILIPELLNLGGVQEDLIDWNTVQVRTVKGVTRAYAEHGGQIRDVTEAWKSYIEEAGKADELGVKQEFIARMTSMANEEIVSSAEIYDIASEKLAEYNITMKGQIDLEERLAVLTGKITEEELAREKAIGFLTKQLDMGNISGEQYLEILEKLASGAYTVEEAIRAITNAINGMPTSKTINIKLNYQKYGAEPGPGVEVPSVPGWGDGGGKNGGPKAAGGDVFPGMAYPVGERGVELFAPNQPGRIIPNDQLSGGTNISIAIYPTPGMDEATVGNIVAQKLSIAFRNMRAGGYARGA